MAKKIIIVLLLFTSFTFSQTPNLTEKWNSTYERYELFNSNGIMIAYVKYNSLYERWETYYINSDNSGYQIQKPQQSVNVELLNKTLTTLQAKYDSNLKKIKEEANMAMHYIYACGKTNGFSYDESNKAYNIFYSDYVKVINYGKYDLSSNATTEKIISFIRDGAFKISCEHLDECI